MIGQRPLFTHSRGESRRLMGSTYQGDNITADFYHMISASHSGDLRSSVLLLHTLSAADLIAEDCTYCRACSICRLGTDIRCWSLSLYGSHGQAIC